MKDNVKRVGLYFNLDIASEAQIWEYLKDKRKSYEIKKILESAIIGTNIPTPITPPVVDKQSNLQEEELDNEAIKF